jgi:hypothetical protein
MIQRNEVGRGGFRILEQPGGKCDDGRRHTECSHLVRRFAILVHVHTLFDLGYMNVSDAS